MTRLSQSVDTATALLRSTDLAAGAAVRELLAEHPPETTPVRDFLGARYDAGLAWIHFPVGLGGCNAPRSLQQAVNDEFAAAGAPALDPGRHGIGLGGGAHRSAGQEILGGAGGRAARDSAVHHQLWLGFTRP